MLKTKFQMPVTKFLQKLLNFRHSRNRIHTKPHSAKTSVPELVTPHPNQEFHRGTNLYIYILPDQGISYAVPGRNYVAVESFVFVPDLNGTAA